MKDEDPRALERGERLEGGIRTAVAAWCENRDAAKDQYGPIASWNTSEITNMEWLFFNKASFYDMAGFNEDISRWDVSNVTSLRATFYGATSFNQQLGGAWAQSTAKMKHMFHNCPGGSIEGRTNNAGGTPQ